METTPKKTHETGSDGNVGGNNQSNSEGNLESNVEGNSDPNCDRKTRIKAFLADGKVRKTSEIIKGVGVNPPHIYTLLNELCDDGDIIKVKRGYYRLKKVDTSLKRTEADNEVTINKALLLFDKMLDDAAETIVGELYTKATMAEKVDLIKSLRWLGATLDQLMKRWNLVNRGYDTNTRQAQEDAKAKTEERQKEALENAPLEDTIMVVGSYDPEAKALIDCIPSSLNKLTDEETEDIKV